MNVQLLVEAVVRETTILIAQIATSGGARAPLAEVADQVFIELVRELESQGVSRKVAADMFGLGLRTFRRKIQRASESATVGGRSLWEAVYDFIRTRELCTRAEVESRFHRDDEELLRGVLSDLTESGFVFRAGGGQHATYRAATPEEMGHASAVSDREGFEDLIWVLVYREGPLSRQRLTDLLGGRATALSESLDRLIAEGRVRETPGGDLAVHGVVLPVGSASGWEAAVFDHVKAMVQTICARLRQQRPRTDAADQIGGSTYGFEIWPGHPHEEEALATLSELRRRLSSLRERIAAHNAVNRLPPARSRVVVYAGQCVLPVEDDPPREP